VRVAKPRHPQIELKAAAPLDTGSGPTVISEAVARGLRLTPSDFRPCVTFENPAPREFPVCTIRLTLEGSFSDSVAAVVMPVQTKVIVGRDVLNQLRVVLDARTGLVEVDESRRPRGP
jgi:hypothetical protein